jgi:hypothetical protein
MNKAKGKTLSKLQQIPNAFSNVGLKVNEIIDSLATDSPGMIARSPLILTAGASGSSIIEIDIDRLGKLIRTDPKAPTTPGGSSSTATGTATVEGASIDVVGSDGKLNKVAKRSNWVSPTSYPTDLKVVNGTTSILLDATGITMTDTAGSGKSMQIAFANLLGGKTVYLRTDDYCDSTTSKTQMHLASAPYV